VYVHVGGSAAGSFLQNHDIAGQKDASTASTQKRATILFNPCDSTCSLVNLYRFLGSTVNIPRVDSPACEVDEQMAGLKTSVSSEMVQTRRLSRSFQPWRNANQVVRGWIQRYCYISLILVYSLFLFCQYCFCLLFFPSRSKETRR
jgi:hypothetical protein